MLDNNHKNSHCAFAERLVSYLYGEIDAREKIEFEKHLSQCSNCADEFADFAPIRSSILELRKEFSTLQTPEIVLPTEKRELLSPTVSISTGDNPRFAVWRRIFSFSPTFAAAGAFAVLAICVGLIWFAAKSSNDDRIARESSKSVNSNNVSPSQKNDNPANKPAEVAENRENSSATNIPSAVKNGNFAKSSNSPAVRNKFSARNSAAKTPTNSVRTTDAKKFASNSNEFVAQRNVVNHPENGKPLVARFEKMPKLSDIEEKDEDSIRLSDLFEEVGADN